MATDVEKLVVQLSADFKGLEKALARQRGVANREFNAIERRARKMNKNLDSIFSRSFSHLTAPIAGLSAVLGTREIARYADEWTVAGNKIAAASVVAGRQARTLSELNDIATETRSGISVTVDLYAKLLRSTANVAKSELEVARATEIVNKAFKAGGAAGSEQAAGILQLAQGLGSGMLQGDELRSVRENAPLLAQAIADYFGTTVAGLKQLGSEGQLTSDKIFKAILSAQGKIDNAFSATNSTIAEGVAMVNNAMIEYVGTADAGYSVTSKLVAGLTVLADNFDKTADVALQLAGVIAGALIGRSVAKMIATLGLAGTALSSFMKALAAARTMGGLAMAFGGLSAAAGPVGMLIGGAVVSSLLLYNSTSDASSAAATRFAEKLKEVEQAAKNSGDAVEEAGKKNKNYNLNTLKEDAQEAAKQFDNAREAAIDYFDKVLDGAGKLQLVRDETGKLSRQPMATPEQYQQLEKLRNDLAKNAKQAEDVKTSLQALANSNPNFQELANRLNPLLEKLMSISTILRENAAKLADANTSRGRSAKDDPVKVDLNAIAADTYEREALRRAALGKSQLTLENEIAKVRNDALKEGITLTEKQIETIAKANIAGDAARSGEGKKPVVEKQERDDEYERLTQSITDRTAALIAETEVQRQLNPLIEDYGYAVEKARAEHDLLTAAQKAGIKVTPELKDQINQLAEKFALATVEAGQLAEAQDRIRQNAEEMADFQRDLAEGIVDGFVNGASAADMFANALSRVGDKLIEIGMNSIFDTGKGGFNIFGALGSMFGSGRDSWSGLRLAGGGHVSGAGTSTSDSIPARLSNGEFVVNAKATRQHRAMLEAINSGRDVISRADGGIVSAKPVSAPRMPIIRPSMQSQPQSAGVHVTLGWSKDADGNIAPIIESVSQKTFKQGIKRYDKGSAVRTSGALREGNGRGYMKR